MGQATTTTSIADTEYLRKEEIPDAILICYTNFFKNIKQEQKPITKKQATFAAKHMTFDPPIQVLVAQDIFVQIVAIAQSMMHAYINHTFTVIHVSPADVRFVPEKPITWCKKPFSEISNMCKFPNVQFPYPTKLVTVVMYPFHISYSVGLMFEYFDLLLDEPEQVAPHVLVTKLQGREKLLVHLQYDNVPGKFVLEFPTSAARHELHFYPMPMSAIAQEVFTIPNLNITMPAPIMSFDAANVPPPLARQSYSIILDGVMANDYKSFNWQNSAHIAMYCDKPILPTYVDLNFVHINFLNSATVRYTFGKKVGIRTMAPKLRIHHMEFSFLHSGAALPMQGVSKSFINGMNMYDLMRELGIRLHHGHYTMHEYLSELFYSVTAQLDWHTMNATLHTHAPQWNMQIVLNLEHRVGRFEVFKKHDATTPIVTVSCHSGGMQLKVTRDRFCDTRITLEQ